MPKNYHSTTGVDEFYYGLLDKLDETKIIGEAPERVKFLQEISVSREQSLEKAYGDNKVAEMATSNGTVEVDSQFHKIPHEDRVALYGLEKSESGLYAFGSNDNPPFVAVIFAKTYEDGSKEWVGLPKGKFTVPEQQNKTKEDGVEFSSDSTKAEFMDRVVPGFADEKSIVVAVDEKGSTTQRDELFKAIFGVEFPAADAVPGA